MPADVSMPAPAPAPGFNRRLLTAMRANGIETGDQLARLIRISRAKAYRLLAADRAGNVDVVTMFRISATLHFSSRWLVHNELPPMPRVPLTPDEYWLVDVHRKLAAPARAAITRQIRALLEQA